VMTTRGSIEQTSIQHPATAANSTRPSSSSLDHDRRLLLNGDC